MYLFSRRARLSGGNGTKGIEWAAGICERVNQSTDLDLSLWAVVYSPGFGTVSWSAFLPDLATLEAAGDKLQADPGYMAASDEGAALTEGGVEDVLYEIVAGTPDPSRAVQYVMAYQASCAAGAAVTGVMVGIELAQRGEAITGVPTLFVRNVTGASNGVGWLSGYESIGQFETAQAALAGDESWLTFVDTKSSTAFAEDVATSTSTMYRKLA